MSQSLSSNGAEKTENGLLLREIKMRGREQEGKTEILWWSRKSGPTC
jgi:hypothetical protein